MRGVKSTPQHKTDNFAGVGVFQLSSWDSLTNAVGLLKEEMRRLGSVILEAQQKRLGYRLVERWRVDPRRLLLVG